MKKTVISTLLIFTLVVTQIGCSVSKLTLTLNAVADAASVAAIAGSLAPAPYGALIMTYSGEVSKWAIEASTELGTGDTNAVKIQKIVTDLATIVVPQIPGAPPNLVATIGAITQAIELFVSQLKLALAATPTTGGVVSAAHGASSIKYHLSMGDKRSLGKVKAKATATLSFIASR